MYVRIAKPGCKLSSYPKPEYDGRTLNFQETVRSVKQRDLKVRGGSTVIHQTSLVLEKTQANFLVRSKFMSVLLKLTLIGVDNK